MTMSADEPPLPDREHRDDRVLWVVAFVIVGFFFATVAVLSWADNWQWLPHVPWLSNLWFNYAWSSDKGNGPEAIQQTIIYAAIAVVLVPAVRKFLKHEFDKVHAKIDLVHQTVKDHHEESKVEREELHAHLRHIGKHLDIPAFQRKDSPVTDTSTTAPRQAGQRGLRAISHRPDLLLHSFRGRQADSGRLAPDSFDATQGLTDFGMLGNDQHSNCGPCGVEHLRMLKAITAVVSGVPTFEPRFIAPTTENTLSWYYAYGIAQGEPGPTPDQGVDNASMLQYIYDASNGKIKTPAGDDVMEWAFAELDPADLNELKLGVVDFGGVLTGQCLPDDAESDFSAVPPIPWKIDAGDPADPNEGHDTVFAKYQPTLGWTVTWGGLQPFVLPTYFSGEEAAKALDAWVIITQEDVDNGKITAEAFAALKSAIESYGGTVAPNIPTPAIVTPPPVVTPPIPTAPPAPVEPAPSGCIFGRTQHVPLEAAATFRTGAGAFVTSGPVDVPAVKLPTWTDPASIAAFLTSIATTVIGILTMLHVTVPANVSADVSTWTGLAAIAIAVGMQIYNSARIASVQKTLIAAGVPIVNRRGTVFEHGTWTSENSHRSVASSGTSLVSQR